jgi:hypothetical protein
MAGKSKSKSYSFLESNSIFFLSFIRISNSPITPLKNTSKHSEILTSIGPSSKESKIS